MQRPAHTSSTESIPPSLAPAGGGWHCSHLYYSFDRTALAQLTSDDRAAGSRDLVAALDPAGADAPLRLQTSIISGQKADFGVMLLDHRSAEDRPRPSAADGRPARPGDSSRGVRSSR